MNKLAFVLGLICLVPFFAGCSNAQEKASAGAVLGGIAGAIIGHQSGERDKGIAIGAASGTVLGYILGNEEDKAEQNRQIANKQDKPRQYNAPPYYEYRERKVWVPGYAEKVWMADKYETRIDANGNPYRVLIEERHYEYIHHDGYWDTRKEKVLIIPK